MDLVTNGMEFIISIFPVVSGVPTARLLENGRVATDTVEGPLSILLLPVPSVSLASSSSAATGSAVAPCLLDNELSPHGVSVLRFLVLLVCSSFRVSPRCIPWIYPEPEKSYIPNGPWPHWSKYESREPPANLFYNGCWVTAACYRWT